MNKFLYAAIGILAVLIVGGSFYDSVRETQTELRIFRDERAAWHRHCDQYVGNPEARLDDPKVKLCKEELHDALARAKAKGWTQ